MTNKAAGRIIIYTETGEIKRWIEADDVARLERQVEAAEAIMREVGSKVSPRLVEALREVGDAAR